MRHDEDNAKKEPPEKWYRKLTKESFKERTVRKEGSSCPRSATTM
jgi:hypothetical protein